MLKWREYKFLILMYIVSTIIFYFLLYKKIDFSNIIILSFAFTGIIKSMYDIKNKTGNQSLYVYSEKKNVILRYITLGVALCFFIFLILIRFYWFPNSEFE